MVVLRSVVFNVIFYLNLIAQMIVFTPIYFLLPRRKAFDVVVKTWSRSNNWLLAAICGTHFKVEGLENIPPGGYILAPKHQSFWDVFALLPLLDHPVYILKRELQWIPLFGWYVMKQKMIPVDRGARGKSVYEVISKASEAMREGRQLIIYPEGTRRQPGAEPAYKYGIARIYRDLGAPVVPVVMHPGLFWPRRKFLRFPGTFTVRILPPIAPGLDPDVFFEKLIQTTEAASDALLLETVRANPQVPLPEVTRRRVEALQAEASA